METGRRGTLGPQSRARPSFPGQMRDSRLLERYLQQRTMCAALGVGQGSLGTSESENVLVESGNMSGLRS